MGPSEPSVRESLTLGQLPKARCHYELVCEKGSIRTVEIKASGDVKAVYRLNRSSKIL